MSIIQASLWWLQAGSGLGCFLVPPPEEDLIVFLLMGTQSLEEKDVGPRVELLKTVYHRMGKMYSLRSVGTCASSWK